MPKQTITVMYTTYITYDVPKGIDLNDEDTYSYRDRWGTIYIDNLKTGETITIKVATSEHTDNKEADYIELNEEDSDSEEVDNDAEKTE